MTVPPKPTRPPTIGLPDARPDADEVVEWWRKSRPRKQRAAPEPAPAENETADTEDQAAEDQQPAPNTTPAYDLNDVVNRLGLLISETPEERAKRLRAEHEAWYERQGETPDQRKARHRSEHAAQRRRASMLWRQPQSERARRFRRWCILTAASASIGYAFGAVQLVAHMPVTAAALTAAGTWALDLRMRGWGHVRVSEARGPGALTVLVLVRVPFASALAGALGLAPLLALFSTHH
ncbi:hypothetical protein GCM10009760_01630 [Kitasatospora kazusensis]|uniref:DUF2637 domain-containing protein n=1 Tax=Kitasatospora kazusensis TaxID=407974 RepID=A0ABN2YNH8_9ACTN